MKNIAAAMLVATVGLASPVVAQDRDKTADAHDKHVAPAHHHVVPHRVTYRRTYKTDQEEHQATEDLNRQYRGMPSSDVR
jgi:hypothetical protein